MLALDAARGAYLVAEDGAYPVAFPSGAKDFTVSLWIKADKGRAANDSVWFWGDNGISDQTSMTAEYLRLNGAAGAMASNWGNNHFLAAATDFHDGAWHHLAKVVADELAL